MAGRNMSVTVQTDDKVACEEVGAMFTRMAARADERVAAILGELSADAIEAQPITGADVAAQWERGETVEEISPAVVALATAKVAIAEETVRSHIPAPPPTAWQPGQPITHGTVITSPPAPPAGQLDKNGLPWDERINTSNRAMTQTGVWKMRKGLPDGLYDSVVAELRQTMAAPAPAEPIAAPVYTLAPPTPDVIVTPPAATFASPDEEAAARAAMAGLGIPVPPPPPPVADATASVPPADYGEFLKTFMPKHTEGKITLEEGIEVCRKHGLPGVPALMQRPDLIPAVFADMEALWLTRG